MTDGESEVQTGQGTQQRLAKLKGKWAHLLRLVGRPACFPPRYKEAEGEGGRENVIPGGTENTVNSSEAGPGGLGVP